MRTPFFRQLETLCIILCLTLSSAGLCAAEVQVTLDPEIAAGLGHPQNQYQCDVRVSPDGTHWAVTAKSRVKETETVVLCSADAGKTWSAQELTQSSDPDCYFSGDGTLHVTMIDQRRETKNQLGYLRSRDGGATWESRQAIPMQVDHPHMTCDLSKDSPYAGTLYVVGRMFSAKGIAIARSRDGGDTWTVHQHDLGAQLNAGFVHNVVVSAKGVILIGMRGKNNMLAKDGKYAGNEVHQACIRSEDAGETVGIVDVGTRVSSADSGPGGMFPVSLALHAYGAGERAYFIASQERPAPQPTGLSLRVSDDLGKTWGDAQPIFPELPAGLGVGESDIIANNQGVVAIRYYATITEIGTEGEAHLPYAVYVIASKDGGKQFGHPVLLSPPQLPYSPWGYQRRVLGADQNFSTALSDGSFVFPWTDTRDRHPDYVVYLRRVRFE